MSNVIFRGPIEREPQTLNLPVAGAYLPGLFVTASQTALTLATAADMEERLYVLSNMRFAGQDIATAYTSGDTGVAYIPKPGDKFQARLAAATYAFGAPLTIGASGYLTAATTGDVVYAYYDDTGATVTAGTLKDVEIANSFVKA